MKDIVIYGAGGLGREVRWLLERINRHSNGDWNFRGYVLTHAEDGEGQADIVGDEAWLLRQPDLHVALAIGTPAARLDVARRLTAALPAERFPILIDPHVIYDENSCVFEPGVIVTAGCILTVNIRMKSFAYINLNCTIGHDTVIGKACVLNPTVKMSGGVNVGDGVLIGTGATVLQYLKIGNLATLGAGAVATTHLESGATYVGVPAKSRSNKTK